jgi:hypothetical protein
MEENMKLRTTLLMSAAAAGLLLTGASAQTVRDEQPRAGSTTRDSGPQPAQRTPDMNRQQAAPQSTAPATGNPRPQAQPQQGQQNAQGRHDGGAQTTQSPQSPGTQSQRQPPAANGQPSNTPSQNRNSADGQDLPANAAPAPARTGATQQPAQQPARQPAQSGQAAPPQAQPAPSAQNRASQPAQNQRSGVVSLNTQQQTQIGQAITRHNVKPLTNVSFSIAVGTRVPRSTTLRALPSDIVTFVPQYRGYSYFVVEEQIVIVEPSSLEIVSIVPYTASRTTSTASSGKAMTSRSVKLSTEQRDVVRKHATKRGATTVRKSYQPGDRIDREITVETFPDTVYTEVPSIRRYRYFRDDDDVVLVDPDEDRVVEVIR